MIHQKRIINFSHLLKMIEEVKKVSSHSNCIKLKVGAIIVDESFNSIASGTNKTFDNIIPCNLNEEKKIEHYSWDEIHSEIDLMSEYYKNNLLDSKEKLIFLTHSPCMSCLQSLQSNYKNLNLKGVIYINYYKKNRFKTGNLELKEIYSKNKNFFVKSFSEVLESIEKLVKK